MLALTHKRLLSHHSHCHRSVGGAHPQRPNGIALPPQLSEKRVDQGGRKSKAEVLRTSRAHNSFVRGRGKGVYAKSRNEGVSGGTPDGASRLSSTGEAEAADGMSRWLRE